LNRWGKIKVMDFGLARATGHKTITIAQSLVGSIYYSSPEQLRGQMLDNRSDIFALGIVLYEMVSGRRPFNGRTMAELSQAIMSGKVQPPNTHNPELSPHLESIILKALERDRAHRYEEAAIMAQELRVLNLQPPALHIASISPSSSLSGLPFTDQSSHSILPSSQPTTEQKKTVVPRKPQIQSFPYLDITLDPPSHTEVQSNEQHFREEEIPFVDTSHISDTSLINQEPIESTNGTKQTQQAPQPQQLLLPQQATFSKQPEEMPIQDRHTVKDQIHRLFRLPSRKPSQSSTQNGKGSTTGA
jgi:serine/threonine protein kinase